jgi:hypothetical protein
MSADGRGDWRRRRFEVMNVPVIRRPALSFSPIVLVAFLLATAGCGGSRSDAAAPTLPAAANGSAAPVAAAPSPSPSPTPEPPAAPQDQPEPDPSPDCIHGTANGVDSVSLAVYFLECNGQRIPGSKDVIEVPVDCRIHFNATPRDGMGAPTCSRTWPIWQVGPEELVSGNGGETFTPAYTTRAPGVMSARCIVDGVRSGWIVLKIVER